VSVVAHDTCPLPDDPRLRAIALALNEGGWWAEIVDAEWRALYMTDEARRIYGGGGELAPYPVGVRAYGTEDVELRESWRGGHWPLAVIRATFRALGPFVLADTPGGREQLRELVAPQLREVVDELSPSDDEALPTRVGGIPTPANPGIEVSGISFRVRDPASGRIIGTVGLGKPTVGMATVARLSAMGDPRHFERMDRVEKSGKRSGAVMFGDLEHSTALSRRLSAAGYFALGRRLVQAADRCVIDNGGLVGRHAGDGVVGLFLTEIAGSESAAAKACIEAARALSKALIAVAERSDLPAELVRIRFGLHWGGTLYVGNIVTTGRTEVNALGDEVNETARIEACASGGRMLASKALIERLEPEAALALGILLDRVSYMPLRELPTATEKARVDAPTISVCEVPVELSGHVFSETHDSAAP
jgi:class 3 adenylate cyclase